MDAGDIVASWALELDDTARGALWGAAIQIAKKSTLDQRAQVLEERLPELLDLAAELPLAPIAKADNVVRKPSIIQGAARCRWRAGLTLAGLALVGLPPELRMVPTPAWRDCWPYRDPAWPDRANGRAQELLAVSLYPAFGIQRQPRSDVLELNSWTPWAGPFGIDGLRREPARFRLAQDFDSPPREPPAAEYFFAVGWLASLGFDTAPQAWREAAAEALFSPSLPAWARPVAREVISA